MHGFEKDRLRTGARSAIGPRNYTERLYTFLRAFNIVFGVVYVPTAKPKQKSKTCSNITKIEKFLTWYIYKGQTREGNM